MLENIQPPAFSPERRARLESLLDMVDQVAAERGTYLKAAKIKTLNNWLKNNDAQLQKVKNNPWLAIAKAIPNQRFLKIIPDLRREYCDDEDSLLTISLLENKSTVDIKKSYGVFTFSYADFMNKKDEKKCQIALNELYQSLLKEFPELLDDAVGREGMRKLTNIFRASMWGLNKAWPKKTKTEKIANLKILLTQSFPEDDVENLHLATANIDLFGAVFFEDLDAIILNHYHLNGTMHWALPDLTHEFEHRRQARLIEKLEKKQLTQGSLEYYQARLFSINVSAGGYLKSSNYDETTPIPHQNRNYRRQPVEVQAYRVTNFVKKMTSKIPQGALITTPVPTPASI